MSNIKINSGKNNLSLEPAQNKLLSLWESLPKNKRNFIIKADLKRKRDSSKLIGIIKAISEKKHWSFDSTISSPNLFKFICQELDTSSEKYITEISLLSIQYIAKYTPDLFNNFLNLANIEIPDGIISKIEVMPFDKKDSLKVISTELSQSFNKDDIKLLYLAFSIFDVKNLEELPSLALEYIDTIKIIKSEENEPKSEPLFTQNKSEKINTELKALEQKLNQYSQKYKLYSDKLVGGVIPIDQEDLSIKTLRELYDNILFELCSDEEAFNSKLPAMEIHKYELSFIKASLIVLEGQANKNNEFIDKLFCSIIGLSTDDPDTESKLEIIKKEFLEKYYENFSQKKYSELNDLLKEDNPYKNLIDFISSISDKNRDELTVEKLHNNIVKYFNPSIAFRIISKNVKIKWITPGELQKAANSILGNSSNDIRVPTKSNKINKSKQPYKVKDEIKKETTAPKVDEKSTNDDIQLKEKIKQSKTHIEEDQTIEEKDKTPLEILETHGEIYDKIFDFLQSDLYSAAYLLNFYINSNKAPGIRQFPNWLLESIVLANNLEESEGELSNRLKELYDNYNQAELVFDENISMNDCLNLFLFSATVIPALKAPVTGASSILLNVKFNDKLDAIFQLIREVIEFSSLGISLDRKYLKAFYDSYDIEKHKKELINETSDWLKRTENKKINYIPAKKVLYSLIKENGLIFKLINPILNNDPNTSELLYLLEQISSNEDYLENTIIKTNRLVNQKKDKIDGLALNTILSKLKEATGFATDWVELNNDKYIRGYDYIYNKAEELRSYFNQTEGEILSELSIFKDDNDKLRNAAAFISIKTINSLKTFFNPTEYNYGSELSVTDYLEEDLVVFSSELWFKILDKIYDDKKSKINFEKFLDLLVVEKDLSKEIVSEFLDYKSTEDFYNLFQYHCNSGNHILAEKISERILKSTVNNIPPDLLDEERAVSTKHHQATLRNIINGTKTLIEIGLTEDLITENQRSEFLSFINGISIESTSNYGYSYYKLNKIQSEINNLKELKKNKLYDRIKLDVLKEKERETLKNLIDKNKLATAQTHLEALERGETIFEFPDNQTRLDIFLQSIGKINSFLAEFDRSPSALREKIESSKINENLGPIRLPSTRTQLNNLQEMLSSWIKIKYDKNINDISDLTVILNWLGFFVSYENLSQDITKFGGPGNYKWFNFLTSNSVHSPIPQFGSSTNNKYKLLCVLQQESISKIIDVIKNQESGTGIIVYNFGRIDEKGRRILCKTCYENRISAIVIDDILLFFLAGLREAQITSALFELSIPFCFVLPYVTAAGNVPREMFYGRQKEISDIIDPKGTCIIYGGRQLGKTAILRKIYNEFNEPDKGYHIIFIDLKAKGYGISNQNPVWQLISIELKNGGIIKGKQQKKFSQFEEELKYWLTTNADGRILVLLDEADKFIETDAKENLVQLSQLRGLMDDTNSRFKFVLSGLHNVQRFTKISNSTISHLLTRGSYCIGPLIGNGEQFEAVKLIVNPFKALGYKFENEEIVYKILNHTNYYPSLIQLFCDNLLKEMYNQINHRFDTNQNPPFFITNTNIDDVYSKKQKLRKDIVDRFQWTLNLDPRYELIAYLIASLSYEDNSLSREGLTIQNVSEEASRWKSELFKSDNKFEDMRGILDEMIGLGILRRTTENKFLLKDSNILRLLGSKDDIEMKLISIDDKTPSVELELDSYRRNDPEKTFEMSPFTAKQENTVLSTENAVILIGGLKALGISQSIKYLKLVINESPIITDYEVLPLKNSNLQNFQKRFDEFLTKKDTDLSIFIIPIEIIWDESWIKYAIERINSRKSTNYIKKIIFLTEGSIIWSLISQSKSVYDELIKEGLQEIRLRKINSSMIETWARDNMIENKLEIIENLGTWTGLYYKYLSRNDGNKVVLEKSFTSVLSADHKSDLMELFGLSNDSIRELIAKMKDFGEPISIDELYEWCDNTFPFNVLEDIIDWCNYFTIINEDSKDKYILDPIVSKIIGIINER